MNGWDAQFEPGHDSRVHRAHQVGGIGLRSANPTYETALFGIPILFPLPAFRVMKPGQNQQKGGAYGHSQRQAPVDL